MFHPTQQDDCCTSITDPCITCNCNLQWWWRLRYLDSAGGINTMSVESFLNPGIITLQRDQMSQEILVGVIKSMFENIKCDINGPLFEYHISKLGGGVLFCADSGLKLWKTGRHNTWTLPYLQMNRTEYMCRRKMTREKTSLRKPEHEKKIEKIKKDETEARSDWRNNNELREEEQRVREEENLKQWRKK